MGLIRLRIFVALGGVLCAGSLPGVVLPCAALAQVVAPKTHPWARFAPIR